MRLLMTHLLRQCCMMAMEVIEGFIPVRSKEEAAKPHNREQQRIGYKRHCKADQRHSSGYEDGEDSPVP